MADWWINPSNASGDGLTRATGWPNFSYATAGNGVGRGDTLKVAALAPSDIAGNRSFSLVQGSQTINYTGDTLVGVVASGDMIAKSGYITTLLDVPYVLTNVTATALTISVNYQGETEDTPSLVKINAYQNIASGTPANFQDEGGLIGGFLEGETDTPTGISWFDRADAAATTLISNSSYSRVKIHRIGFYRYTTTPFYLNNSYGIDWDEIYVVACTYGQGCGNLPTIGNGYSCSNIANNYGGFHFGEGVYCKNYVAIGNNGNGAPRGQYILLKDVKIENYYAYGNTGYGFSYSQLAIITNFHSARNTSGALRVVANSYGLLIHNVVEADTTLCPTVTGTAKDTEFLAVMNHSGNRYKFCAGGYIYYNTTEAYNVECLEFRPNSVYSYSMTWIMQKGLYAECSTNTALTISWLMKRNASWANGTVQYSVWFEEAQIVDWTDITLTTSYQEFTHEISGTLIPRNGAVELRVRVKATAGYAYLAERNGYYVQVN